MARQAQLWCCTAAHKCSWARTCSHAKPHRHRKSCDTPCRRKMGPSKCVVVRICEKCKGIGYSFKGMKK